MPTKCMDHTPIPPSARPAVAVLTRLICPLRVLILRAAVSATKEPMTEMTYDRATNEIW